MDEKLLVLSILIATTASGCLSDEGLDGDSGETPTSEKHEFKICTHTFYDSEFNIIFDAPGCPATLGNVTLETGEQIWEISNITTGFAFIIEGDSRENLHADLEVSSENRSGVSYEFDTALLLGQSGDPEDERDIPNAIHWAEEDTKETLFFSACDEQSLRVRLTSDTMGGSLNVEVIAYQPDPYIAQASLSEATCDGWWGE